MIEFKKVSRTYTLGGETIHALDSVSLHIEEGEFIAIMGPSGSGKSTFLNLIGGLDKPDAGDVIVEDKHLQKLSDKKLSAYRNKTVGFIFQSFHLQPLYTAVENVMMPMYFSRVHRKQRKEAAAKALQLVGIADRADHKPSQMSGGQQQRTAIARALVNEPRILLADEPTGNLDSKNGKAVMKLLTDLNKKEGLTIIMVTHDPDMAKYADRTIRLKDGAITKR